MSSIVGCSRDGQHDPVNVGEARLFSDEDKRAAQVLSISNSHPAISDADPYDRALRCRNGVEALAERFETSSILDARQKRALGQARQLYDRQLQEIGRGEGKSATDIALDIDKFAEENGNVATNIRTAVACLQTLERNS